MICRRYTPFPTVRAKSPNYKKKNYFFSIANSDLALTKINDEIIKDISGTVYIFSVFLL